MKYYLIAGEASGDLHGANLIRALRQKDTESIFRFWGGDRMADVAGGQPIKHFRELAFMGFIEVVSNLSTILGNLKLCKADITKFQPDALILIDYPGFNLRIAKWAKTRGIKVLYYISPQVWAWKANRVHKIKRDVDRLYSILPFEKDFFQRYDYEVTYVGHPLLDAISTTRQLSPLDLPDQKPVIALLPGSRQQEINALLPVMLEVIPDFPDYRFVIGAAPSVSADFYQAILGRYPEQAQQVSLVQGVTYSLMQAARAALVTSGTATLETALFNTPEVVCYRGSSLSYWIAKRLVKIKYISLVNLILDRPLVQELIQQDCNAVALQKALQQILEPGMARDVLLEGYVELREKLGKQGASERVAEDIQQFLLAE